MKLYDDFIVFMKCFELSVLQRINMYLLVDSAIYLYNTLCTNSATYSYSNLNDKLVTQHIENTNFLDSIKHKYLAIRDWDLKKIPRLSIGQFNEPGELCNKLQFVENIVKQIPISQIYLHNINNINLIIQYAKENKNKYLLHDLILLSKKI